MLHIPSTRPALSFILTKKLHNGKHNCGMGFQTTFEKNSYDLVCWAKIHQQLLFYLKRAMNNTVVNRIPAFESVFSFTIGLII